MIAFAALLALTAAHPNPEGLKGGTGRDRIDIVLPAGMDRRIGSLAVVRGARWAFLVDEQGHYASFRPGVRHPSLQPSLQLGAVDGKPARAFSTAAAYRIVFADNLETEPGDMISLDCRVRVRWPPPAKLNLAVATSPSGPTNPLQRRAGPLERWKSVAD